MADLMTTESDPRRGVYCKENHRPRGRAAGSTPARTAGARSGAGAPNSLPGDSGQRRFHGASVGKMMTATLAFQLAQSGHLDLGASLPVAFFPQATTCGLFVPMRVSMPPPTVTPYCTFWTHTTVSADYFEGLLVDAARLLVTARVTRSPNQVSPGPTDLLAFPRALQRSGRRNRGETFYYSDTGYVLLGRVIEEAGGATLGTQLHESDLRPGRDGCIRACMFHTLPGRFAHRSTLRIPAAELDIAPDHTWTAST